jgi:hypothetical protein
MAISMKILLCLKKKMKLGGGEVWVCLIELGAFKGLVAIGF